MLLNCDEVDAMSESKDQKEDKLAILRGRFDKNSDSDGRRQIGVHFGEALKLERDERGLSQKQLADLVGGTTQQAVAHWEAGRMYPRPDKWAKLIEIFGKDSLLAEFAQQRGQRTERTRSVILDSSPGSAQEYDRTTVSDPGRDTPEVSRCPVTEEIKRFLPPAYHCHLDRPVGASLNRLELDYLSDRLAVELRRIPSQGLHQQIIDRGLHYLNKARLLLANDPPEVFVLILIGQNPDNWTLVRRALADAALFGVEVVLKGSVAEAAELIAGVEAEGVSFLFNADGEWSDDE